MLETRTNRIPERLRYGTLLRLLPLFTFFLCRSSRVRLLIREGVATDEKGNLREVEGIVYGKGEEERERVIPREGKGKGINIMTGRFGS